MPNLVSEVAIFLQPVGMGVILIYIFGVIARKDATEHVEQLSLGFVFGLAAVIAMADPIEIASGIIVDMRNLFVGIAAAFFGVRGGAVALGMAVAARLGIGGAGAHVGIFGVIIAASMGYLWAREIRPRIANNYVALPCLALMISTHVFASVLLPDPIMIMFLTTFAPILVLLNLLCTVIFATLIYRERKMVGYENRLQTEASTDPLTRVLNRRSAIRAYGSVERDKPPKRGISMTCIDVDKFKTINDVHGHLAGDLVLKEVADRIGTCIRPKDIYCRMSGDEFLFVLINVTSEEARQVTERCRSLIARVPIAYMGNPIDVSISLGTVWAARPLPFEDFRSSADSALYEAKEGGRNISSFGTQHHTPKIA